MAHLCCSSGIPPVSMPADGVEGGVSGQELGAELGLARNPNTGNQIADQSRDRVDLAAPYVPTITMGVPRSMLRPAGNAPYPLRNDGFDGAVGWQDTHNLFEPGASMAQGEQERVQVTQRNTWRSRPEPWDTNLYVGSTP